MSSDSSLHTLAQVPSGGSLEDALADSLSGIQFIDTTFYACTRRLQSGKAGKPRAVRANSTILKASSTYFRGLLSGPAYSVASSDALSAEHFQGSDDRYECESDSDLEDEDDDLDVFGSLLATPSEVESAKEKTDDKPAGLLHTDSASGAAAIKDGTRAVRMNSVAADTLEALIFYIYTGNIYFLPLRSHGTKVREEAKAKHHIERKNRPYCSCKSIYRFADEVGLAELKQQAENRLFSQLDAENILDELFSRFTLQYPDILTRQIRVLLDNYWTASTQAALSPKIQSVVRGDVPHAGPVLLSLLSHIPATPKRVPPADVKEPAIAPPPTIQKPATSPLVTAPPPVAALSPIAVPRPVATPSPVAAPPPTAAPSPAAAAAAVAAADPSKPAASTPEAVKSKSKPSKPSKDKGNASNV
ncbi:uncharacterized protein PHACADRAFT_214399 [Phanerochaete carnosa HHB-10118-sp]|uniref:BTB domain-containing protein n=1 Tax=Phanerochaete carnosa (strain HHB-10118-sp) TaxID=650164 RepID=K5VFG8_PHACS|nr:uncharacterized protein PHACADRAFT_214399 [Phanerochaete carnosa HHB-10118-sp]EKM49883.1 hypothetical protein PHACADRAFT_214399 [Phanerochaete carnosa HHB-10118-sp]